jgi:hypothetical protein
MNVNIYKNSLFLFTDNSLTGFNETTKKKNLSNLLNNYNNYAFILELCLFLIFSSIFGILIYQVNKIELEYIRALIRFNSKPFEIYLKSLFELKNKIMDTNLDDDLQAKGDDEEKELLIKEDDSAHMMDNNKKKQRKKSQIFENQIVKLTNMGDSKKEQKTKEGESISKKEDNMRHKKIIIEVKKRLKMLV